MTTLWRSSTSRSNRKQQDATPHSPGLRLRSTSFTQTLGYKQKSESFFSQSTSRLTPIFTRRPSLDAKSHTVPQRPPASPLRQTMANTESHLAVIDMHAGGASSIDSGSEDEEDVPPAPAVHVTSNDYVSSPIQMSCTDTHDFKVLPPSAIGQKSLSSSLKDRLTISRRQGPKRQRSMFMRFNRGSREKQDDTSPNDSNQTTDPSFHNPLVPSERDTYGFTKATQWLTLADHQRFETMYQPIMYRRLLKWRQLLADHNGEWPAKNSKIKRYIRKGIPPELRPQAWMHFSGAKSKMEKNPGVYQEYVCRAEAMGAENEYLDIIERDLHRTFPDNIRFKSTNETNDALNTDVPAIRTLRRLLSAFSLYAPNIGYCQSLNYIAGLLILFMEEEEAFWTFTTLIEDILPQNIYDVTMEGANIDQTVLMMLLSERFPHIWHKIGGGKSFWECEEANGNGMPTVSLVTSHWFLTLFINILPTESVLRVWDCVFYEGQRALFRVALAIFRMNEDTILAVDDPLELFQVVQNMPKKMIDCHQLLDATYNKYASLTRLSQQDLEKRRELFRSRREQRRKAGPGQTLKLKRGKTRGAMIYKAMEARRLADRTKSVRQQNR